MISRKEAIFCANFGCLQFGSKVCQNCWCPTCYRISTIVDFSVWRKKDPITGEEIADEGDDQRYMVARAGDALVAPFECDDCVFCRLEYYWPEWKTIKERTLGGAHI
jgi:hypothetical protein